MTYDVTYLTQADVDVEEIASTASKLGYACKIYHHESGKVLDIRFGGNHWANNGAEWHLTEDYWMCWRDEDLEGAEDEERAFIESLGPKSIFIWSFHLPGLAVLIDLLHEVLTIYGGVIWAESAVLYTADTINAVMSEFPMSSIGQPSR